MNYSTDEAVRFILPEMVEMEKTFSSRHFWTALVIDTNLIIYRADRGFEVLGLGPGIMIASVLRARKAKKKIGAPISAVMPANRRHFVFSRQGGSIKLKTTKRGVVAKRKVIVLTDSEGSVELNVVNKHFDALKEHCKEIELISS